MPVITLLSDFGTADGYAGIMRGVILGINPRATVVDVSHSIAPQEVHGAAFVLSTAYPYFPAGAVHVVVVDPGVGSERRAIAVRAPNGTFVAPDNGVLSYVLAREPVSEMVCLTNARYWLAPLSDTFHGRDLFAPVAAHLSLGIPPSEMGQQITDPVRLEIAEPQVREDGAIVGEVLHVDGFGNLVTNVPQHMLPEERGVRTQIAGREVMGRVKTYAVADDSELLTLVGSHGHLEISVRNGSAAAELKVGRGAEVIVCPVSCGS